MRIGVNTRLFVKGKMDGIAWFSYEILKRIVVQHPEHEFVFFFDRQWEEEFVFAPNVKPVKVNPPARHPILWFLFFEIGIKRALKKEKIDLFISTDGWCCLGTKVQTINVIHDLNFEHHPDFLPITTRVYMKHFFPKFAQKADKLITVSEFSKYDISDTFKIDAQKISVVYNGVSDIFSEVSEQTKKETRQKLTSNFPYFVFVGTPHKRKNLARILKAFDKLRENHEIRLVFAGMNKYWDSECLQILKHLKHKNDLVFTGYLSTQELNNVVGSAKALLYPSLFEGFGIPILEAFACKIPVITSNSTSMPEVAGGAALLVNPLSEIEIENAMLQILTDESLCQSLINRGTIQLQQFSWDRSADKFWVVVDCFIHK